jgi:hypothetical protein
MSKSPLSELVRKIAQEAEEYVLNIWADEIAELEQERKRIQLEYVGFRQDARAAIYPFWRNNPGVGNNEITEAVGRCVAENKRLRTALEQIANELRDAIWEGITPETATLIADRLDALTEEG